MVWGTFSINGAAQSVAHSRGPHKDMSGTTSPSSCCRRVCPCWSSFGSWWCWMCGTQVPRKASKGNYSNKKSSGESHTIPSQAMLLSQSDSCQWKTQDPEKDFMASFRVINTDADSHTLSPVHFFVKVCLSQRQIPEVAHRRLPSSLVWSSTLL